ncbi:DUF3500 domain-containing protein (plasmid) [Spirosoma oryzicola]|nr:DUF3500 domain-containing protein [Spirosoma oryzicola]UHG94182.1 DUF3500 domain-containing protein [Spirosoma oryzicola]
MNAIKLIRKRFRAYNGGYYLTKYTSELASTYIPYSGATSVASQNDYIRIDGPSLWIEFSYQGGVIIRNTPHSHSVWRDHTSDCGVTNVGLGASF